jgi:hypothetical protein
MVIVGDDCALPPTHGIDGFLFRNQFLKTIQKSSLQETSLVPGTNSVS